MPKVLKVPCELKLWILSLYKSNKKFGECYGGLRSDSDVSVHSLEAICHFDRREKSHNLSELPPLGTRFLTPPSAGFEMTKGGVSGLISPQFLRNYI